MPFVGLRIAALNMAQALVPAGSPKLFPHDIVIVDS
jgi:hypothetical protein